MSRFSCAVKGVAATSGSTIATIHTGSTLRAFIYEIGINLNAATATSLGLIRPANSPSASTSVLGQNEDGSSGVAATVNVDTSWGTAPTITSQVYLRRVHLAASQNVFLVWTWPYGLILPTSSYLVLWNGGSSTCAATSIYVAWEE